MKKILEKAILLGVIVIVIYIVGVIVATGYCATRRCAENTIIKKDNLYYYSSYSHWDNRDKKAVEWLISASPVNLDKFINKKVKAEVSLLKADQQCIEKECKDIEMQMTVKINSITLDK